MTKRTAIVMLLTILLTILLFTNFNIQQEPPERTIIGKGADGAGNVWIIVSSCETCEQERVGVGQLDDYKIGQRFP